jgi:hypothetical protein
MRSRGKPARRLRRCSRARRMRRTRRSSTPSTPPTSPAEWKQAPERPKEVAHHEDSHRHAPKRIEADAEHSDVEPPMSHCPNKPQTPLPNQVASGPDSAAERVRRLREPPRQPADRSRAIRETLKALFDEGDVVTSPVTVQGSCVTSTDDAPMRPKERCRVPSRRGNSTAPRGPVVVDGELAVVGYRSEVCRRCRPGGVRGLDRVRLPADPTILAGSPALWRRGGP